MDLIPRQELEVYESQLGTAEKFGLSLEVNSEDDYHAAMIEGKTIKNQLEIIVKRKESITKPQYEAYKSAMDFFKPFETKLKSTLDIIKAKMLSYTNEKERLANEAKAKIDARVEKGTLKEANAEVKKFMIDNSMQKTVSNTSGSATTKKVKKYYVTDISKVPLDFLEVDMVKVKASYKSGFPVPGTIEKIENELSLS